MEHCENCGVAEDDQRRLSECGACQSALYCGEACQRAHWFMPGGHRHRCRQIQMAKALRDHNQGALARLSSYSRVVNARVYDEFHGTALHLCAEEAPELVHRLLQGGVAHVNARNDRGETPLFLACQRGDGSVGAVQALLEAGADPDSVANNGYSAIMLAIRERGLGVVQALLQAGADMNVGRNLAGRSPMGLAELYASGQLQFIQEGEEWDIALQQHRDILEFLQAHVAANGDDGELENDP